jgi:hypothetical protein
MMRDQQDAMMLVRAELCERLASMRNFSAKIAMNDFARSLTAIRTLAAAYGLMPVVRLAEALERAVAEDAARPGPGCATSLYLDRLQDAIGCSRNDEQVSEAMIASVSVRLCA